MGAPAKCGSSYQLINGQYQLVKDCSQAAVPKKCGSSYVLVDGRYELVSNCSKAKAAAPKKCGSSYVLVDGRYELVSNCSKAKAAAPKAPKTCGSSYQLVNGRYQLVQQSRPTLTGADGKSYTGSCQAAPAPAPSLSDHIATAVADKNVTAQELARVWNALDTNRTEHGTPYDQFVTSIQTGTVTLSSGANRLLFNVGHWMKKDWSHSPLAGIEGRNYDSTPFLLATLDHYGGYKQVVTRQLGSVANQRSYNYRILEGNAEQSIRLYYDPSPYTFKELKAHEALRVNANPAQHYVSKRSIPNALQELRQLADTARLEEGWLQITIQPFGGGAPESYFYEVGVEEQPDTFNIDSTISHQAMRDAARRGRILKVIDYHIHPNEGSGNSSYAWPPSAADLVSLHSRAQWFRKNWPDLPLVESGVVSDKAVWRLTISDKALAAPKSTVKRYAETAIQCMLKAPSNTATNACYNNDYFNLTHRMI